MQLNPIPNRDDCVVERALAAIRAVIKRTVVHAIAVAVKSVARGVNRDADHVGLQSLEQNAFIAGRNRHESARGAAAGGRTHRPAPAGPRDVPAHGAVSAGHHGEERGRDSGDPEAERGEK